MTDPTQQFRPPSPEDAPESSSDPARTWKIVTALLAVVAIGLGIWAVVLNNDLKSTEDDASSQIASLEAANQELSDEVASLKVDVEEAQTETEVVTKAAKTALNEAVEALGVAAEGLVVQDAAIAEATKALDDANAALTEASGELATTEAQRDQALALAENAQLCAAGSLNAVELIADGDIDGATAALEQVAPSCKAALG